MNIFNWLAEKLSDLLHIMSPLINIFNSLGDKLFDTFIKNKNYEVFISGISTTLLLTITAAAAGTVIGTIIASIRVYSANTGRLRIVNALFGAYVTVFRAIPVIVQLLIWRFVILTSVNSAVLVGAIGLSINSSAYVAEIVRSGIQAVDPGQTEAGRSLGLSSFSTMLYIILPQAIKNVLPALGNELIALLKETAVVSTITVQDISGVVMNIRASTFDVFFLLIFLALVYLVLVMLISRLVKIMERRLRRSDRGT